LSVIQVLWTIIPVGGQYGRYGGQHCRYIQKPLKQEKPKVKRTIFDFFQLDLKVIPDDSFAEGANEINIVNETVRNFYKTLDYKECDIYLMKLK
jgi:hypothetical protein